MRPRWARRHLLLAHNLLYAFRSPECGRATCLIFLEGWSVCAAGEVKSRAHAFKVYCVGSAFYFAAATRQRQQAWIQLLQRATLQSSPAAPSAPVDLSKRFSETEYSETSSEGEEGRERPRAPAAERDKGKFGSLKKLTTRMRSESQESVAGAGAASLDRKYLRFFGRHRARDDKPHKNKQLGVPVPTEHYRSYRRVADPPAPLSPLSPLSPSPPDDRPKKIPKPINFIHASNPNLVEFERSEFVGRPSLQPRPKVQKPETFLGFVTLEEFMLKKQEEERRQMYTNRVLMGIERDKLEERNSGGKKAAKELQKRLDRIVPDVIYGQLERPDGAAPRSPGRGRGRDGGGAG
ncbi:uncharacterized protein LOC113238844 [Hyposmocoma kahamanoa]|uniref:uncharacterized protein LOC113238844 n=1 Tax=Hyposmocoma kahamanoa TaxID=1477025 RepID=UPI000E6D9AF4|nr:uncharacterized protein LOC113238844 [Hyposmocoma kahamanoa]